jgi:hypothetical protein
MTQARSSNSDAGDSERRGRRKNSYYVVTKRSQTYPPRWFWEVRRHKNPMGVRLSEDGFETEKSARAAGEAFLTRFLDELSENITRERASQARESQNHLLVGPWPKEPRVDV